MPSLSVVIPVYNGASSIGPLMDDIRRNKNGYDLQIVLVNDGSKDNSETVCARLAEENDDILFVSLRKNFGEHNAVMCGLNYATGDVTVIIDDDFQNPPSEIIKLTEACQQGYDVVYSRYHRKQHHWFRNLGSRLNDAVATWLLSKPKTLYLSSFKAIRREVVDEIIKYRGPFPYVDGLIMRVTRNIGWVYVDHAARNEGRSNYTLKKLISLYLNMFLNFSIKPLRVFTATGFFMFVVGSVLSLYFILDKLIHPDIKLGWTSIMVSVLVFNGIQLMFMGLIGEYLGKNYLDQNGTPQWVIKKIVGNPGKG